MTLFRVNPLANIDASPQSQSLKLSVSLFRMIPATVERRRTHHLRSQFIHDGGMDLAKSAWKNYLIQLQAHPLRTKAITAGVLAGCSDAIAQKISGVKKIQFRRLLLLMLYGFAYGGPWGHFFHKLMDAIFKGKKDNSTVAKKVLLEQLTSSPWNNFLFMSYYGLVVEGRPWKLVKHKVGKDYSTIQFTAWKFWPVVGWVNYQYVPLQFRVLFSSFVASCWSIFLNLKARSAVIKNT